ncbi:MAG: hypothetical protein F4107_12870 [Gemmatimonadetes bacterium]|nr:hypothetical protein [Gemmatimonadota bacterium]MYD14664.1 hypothetical protein [Gemmatimonadota bacterium]MYI66806.1 hypothetical protein [Gemmatimonadota bacterium]
MRSLNKLAWLTALLVVPGGLAAQNPGSTVRVNGETLATFQRADSSGVYLNTGFIPFDQVEYLEIRTGFKRKTLEGVLLGALAGLAVPIVGGSLTCSGDNGLGDLACVLTWGYIGLASVPVGTLAGGVIGYNMKTPIFEPVAFPPVFGNGIGVGFHLRF